MANRTDPGPGGRTAVVAHPGAELYGSDRVLLESVAALVERGWRTVVVLPGTGPLCGALEDAGAQVEVLDVPVLRKAAMSPRGLLALSARTLLSLPALVRLLRRERPAVLYVSTLTVPVWLLAGALRRVPVVVHVHEAEASAPAPVRLALNAPLLLARRVVVNSDFSLGVLTRAVPGLARRSEVVLNGVPGPAAVVPPREELTGPVRLLYVGRLSSRKGVDVAVEATAELRRRGLDAELDVVGSAFPGYEWFVEQLDRAAAAPELAGRVRRHGFSDAVWDHLASADVLLVPSRLDEPFGNTAVEGRLAARPVVASATSGLLEAVAGSPSCRSVTPGSGVAVADAVAELVDAWPEVREQALRDALLAAERHAPAGYRERLAEQVARAAGVPSSAVAAR
ncbi:glycosyltransferase family 4 protein [Streptomyces sp. NP160]|uniref:glycosyltransferase family 4 protein n=1 Tax=Streptomyces sp. NP160 TaxID=2586637 RepID=UPI001C55A6D6|nr:glycosyltransferase family 4 protein [Streptomyces sp. NP160]